MQDKNNNTKNTEPDFTSPDSLLNTNPHLYIRWEHSGQSLEDFAKNQMAKTQYPNLYAAVGSITANIANREKAGGSFVKGAF